MRNWRWFWSVIFGPLLLFAAGVDPAAAQKRIALVVGINDYPKMRAQDQLLKAVADAETMSAALRSLKFDVEFARNVDRGGFLSALDRIRRKIGNGDTFFLFFAGHGIALRGSNFLLPSDIPPIDPEAEQLVRGMAVAETDVIDMVRERGASLVILALDACRNNPIEEFAREQARIQGRTFTRSASPMRSVGLETRPTSGVFSIYSAGIGQRALDGLITDGVNDRNSVFTRVFAKKLTESGRHLSDVMEDVKEEVAKLAATSIDPVTKQSHRQFPAFYNETQGGRVYLAGLPSNENIPKPSQAELPAPDEIHWSVIKDMKLAAVFEEFQTRYPKSKRALEAVAKLKELNDLAKKPEAGLTSGLLFGKESLGAGAAPDSKRPSDQKAKEPPVAALDPNTPAPRPKIPDRVSPSGPSQVAPVLQRVILYDEDPSEPLGKQYVGTVSWRTEQVKGSGNTSDVALRGDVDIPGRKLKMTIAIRRNTDKSLPASHTAELTFTLPSDFNGGGIANVPGLLMKSNEQARGTPLSALAVKVTDSFFLVGLSNIDKERERNIQLLKERSWFDVPLVYANQRRAIIAIEKGLPGDRASNEAFAAWGQ